MNEKKTQTHSLSCSQLMFEETVQDELRWRSLRCIQYGVPRVSVVLPGSALLFFFSFSFPFPDVPKTYCSTSVCQVLRNQTYKKSEACHPIVGRVIPLSPTIFLSPCKFSTRTRKSLYNSRLYAQNPVFEIVHQESVKVYLHMYKKNVQQNSLCAAFCVTKDIPILTGSRQRFLSPGKFSTMQCTVFYTLQLKLMYRAY